MVKYQLFGLTFREFLRIHYDIADPGLKLTDIIHPERSARREIVTAGTKSTGKSIAILFDEHLRRGYYVTYFCDTWTKFRILGPSSTICRASRTPGSSARWIDNLLKI